MSRKQDKAPVAPVVDAPLYEGHTGSTFRIAPFARAHNIDPKMARARMRKAFSGGSAPVASHNKHDSWTFDVADAPTVLSIIKGKRGSNE